MSLDTYPYLKKSNIAKSRSRLIPSFLRICHIDCHSDYTNLHAHQQWRRVPFVPHLCQHGLSLMLFILVIWTGEKWNHNLVYICISLMAKDVKHFFEIPLFILDISLLFNWELVSCRKYQKMARSPMLINQ